MVKFFREYWFGFLIGCCFFIFIGFAILVMVAPHSDAKMRGFTPCTYNMAKNLSASPQVKMRDVFSQINKTYWCYLGVIYEGGKNFFTGKQESPWSNYLFESEIIEINEFEGDDVEIEPYSEDLLDANLLNDEDDDGKIWKIGVEEKESNDEEK